MASAFGGQRSIQLSYGCLWLSIASGLRTRNAKTSAACHTALPEQIVAKLKRVNQHINFIGRIIQTK